MVIKLTHILLKLVILILYSLFYYRVKNKSCTKLYVRGQCPAQTSDVYILCSKRLWIYQSCAELTWLHNMSLIQRDFTPDGYLIKKRKTDVK